MRDEEIKTSAIAGKVSSEAPKRPVSGKKRRVDMFPFKSTEQGFDRFGMLWDPEELKMMQKGFVDSEVCKT
jgi:hypothetical protein